MKKIFKAMSAIVLSFVTIAGCSCNKGDNKAALSKGDVNATTYEVVSIDYVDTLIKDKESFVLYVYDEYCQGCGNFKPIIEEVIQERDLIVYALQIGEIKKTHELSSLKSTPALAVYSKGEAIFKGIRTDYQDYFATTDGFKSFLDKYTYAPTLYYINKQQLDTKIANNENFIIYYSRSTCGDCSYLNENYLKTYLQNNYNTKKFYIIETDVEGIRYYNGASPKADGTDDQKAAYAQWVAFKDTYGLSNVNNKTLGHGAGYVPTMQYYEDGEIKDMLVYFNDFNTYDNGYVTIDNSYYSDNPYKGQQVKYSEYQEKLAPFYNTKVEAFLNKNLAKVD